MYPTRTGSVRTDPLGQVGGYYRIPESGGFDAERRNGGTCLLGLVAMWNQGGQSMQTIDTRPVGTELKQVGSDEQRDRVFETLSNHRRRQVLRFLRTHEADGPVLIRDLAEQIAAWENEVPIVEVAYKQRKRVYTSLYQSHLPRMHRYGFVEYDADRGTIELTPQSEQLEIYLETVPEGHLSWSEAYLGTSAVAAAFVAALYIGAIPFVTSWHALAFFVLVFLGLSVAHTIETNENALFGE